MKKTIAFFLTILLCCPNYCLASSELYYLKNVKTDKLIPIIEESYRNQNFDIIKKNPYYGISKNGDSVVIIIQQSGENLFYYYNSDSNTKINKAILKTVKNDNIVCEQSFNNSIINIYDNLVNSIITDTATEKRYTFEEPQNSFFEPPATQVQQNQNVYKGYVSKVPTGTKIQIYLQNAINTATAAKGDKIIAVIQNPVVQNGIEVIPQGSIVSGKLTKAKHATYGSQNGKVEISFKEITTPDNKTYNINTEQIDFCVSNEGKLLSSVKGAAKSAVAGAAVGMLFALLCDNSIWRAAAIGAGIGAGSSAVYSTAEKGVDAEIPSFTEMEIILKSPISVTIGN